MKAGQNSTTSFVHVESKHRSGPSYQFCPEKKKGRIFDETFEYPVINIRKPYT